MVEKPKQRRKTTRKQREVVYRKIAKKRPFQRWRSRPFGNQNPSEEDERLWRLIDGAVADAFLHHPKYLTEKGREANVARRSIVKRVFGVIKASRKRGADRVLTSAADRQES